MLAIHIVSDNTFTRYPSMCPFATNSPGFRFSNKSLRSASMMGVDPTISAVRASCVEHCGGSFGRDSIGSY